MRYGDRWNDHMGSDWLIAGGLFWVVLSALVIVALVLALRVWAVRGGPSSGPSQAARTLDVLDDRLAHGAIDANEYDRIRERLLRGR